MAEDSMVERPMEDLNRKVLKAIACNLDRVLGDLELAVDLAGQVGYAAKLFGQPALRQSLDSLQDQLRSIMKSVEADAIKLTRTLYPVR